MPSSIAHGAEVSTSGVATTFRRGRDPVELNFPDLNLTPGEHVVLVGPSGSGKTTLLHMLAGLHVPERGSIMVGEERIDQLGESARDAYRSRSIGYLFQDFHLVDDYTAQENVILGLGLAGVPRAERRARAHRSLEAVDLARQAHQFARTLSTGERQRVALARAVGHRPRLLIADEPTAHLDRKRAEQALALLRDTARNLQVTLIIATHDPLVSDAISSRIELGT